MTQSVSWLSLGGTSPSFDHGAQRFFGATNRIIATGSMLFIVLLY